MKPFHGMTPGQPLSSRCRKTKYLRLSILYSPQKLRQVSTLNYVLNSGFTDAHQTEDIDMGPPPVSAEDIAAALFTEIRGHQNGK